MNLNTKLHTMTVPMITRPTRGVGARLVAPIALIAVVVAAIVGFSQLRASDDAPSKHPAYRSSPFGQGRATGDPRGTGLHRSSPSWASRVGGRRRNAAGVDVRAAGHPGRASVHRRRVLAWIDTELVRNSHPVLIVLDPEARSAGPRIGLRRVQPTNHGLTRGRSRNSSAAPCSASSANLSSPSCFRQSATARSTSRWSNGRR